MQILTFPAAITCPALPTVNNGMISYSTIEENGFSFGTFATHTCNAGFFREGNENRECSGDGSSVNGTWTGTAPICGGIVREFSTKNHTVMFSLYTDIMCDALPNPTNGLITFSEDTNSLGFMATATYGCNAGFGLSGGDRVRNCGSSSSGPGTWSGTAPTCEGKLLLFNILFNC